MPKKLERVGTQPSSLPTILLYPGSLLGRRRIKVSNPLKPFLKPIQPRTQELTWVNGLS